MSHFSHPPLQVYRRCRLKETFANYDYSGLSAEDKRAWYENSSSGWQTGCQTEGWQKWKAEGLCFPNALERTRHLKSHISKCSGAQAGIRYIFSSIFISSLTFYAGNLVKLGETRPSTCTWAHRNTEAVVLKGTRGSVCVSVRVQLWIEERFIRYDCLTERRGKMRETHKIGDQYNWEVCGSVHVTVNGSCQPGKHSLFVSAGTHFLLLFIFLYAICGLLNLGDDHSKLFFFS